MRILKLVPFLLLFGCYGFNNDNKKEDLLYLDEVKQFDCQRLNRDNSYWQQNLNLVSEQLDNSNLDSVAEFIISLGLSSYLGKYHLHKNRKLFEEKINIINNEKIIKNCYV